jgi:hypothetical protein
MVSIHVTWWNNIDSQVQDDMIQTMHEICQLGLDIDSIIEKKTVEHNSQIEELAYKLENEREHTRLVVEKEMYTANLENERKVALLESENTELIAKIREKDYLINNTKPDNTVHEIKELILQTLHFKKQQVELGNDGESLIDSLVYDKYPDCIIEDTSGFKNKGDRILKFRECSVLIESKNVKQETLSGSMKRYSEQITTDLIKEYAVNNTRVGILVSIRDVTFNGGDYFKLEIAPTKNGNVGIVYCSNVKNNPFLLYSAIQLAKKLNIILDNEADETELLDTIKNCIPAINGIMTVVSKNQSSLEQICESNKKIFSSLEQIFKQLTNVTPEGNGNFIADDYSVQGLYEKLRIANRGKVTLKQLKSACDQEGLHHNMIKSAGGIASLKKTSTP